MLEQVYPNSQSFSMGKQLLLPFPDLASHLSTSRVSVGFAGELLASRALEAAGYRVRMSHENGDLTVTLSTGEILYIEVKTSRYGKDGTYRFTLYKHWQGRQCADHRNAHIVILLCVSRTGHTIPFVVPTADIGNRRALSITNRFPTKYQGWLAAYRQVLTRITLPPPPQFLGACNDIPAIRRPSPDVPGVRSPARLVAATQGPDDLGAMLSLRRGAAVICI